jgi:hypothetical protein
MRLQWSAFNIMQLADSLGCPLSPLLDGAGLPGLPPLCAIIAGTHRGDTEAQVLRTLLPLTRVINVMLIHVF